MRTAKNRLGINELPDVFGPRELAMVLGVAQGAGYELAQQEDFPSFRIRRKLLITKSGFQKWLEEQHTKKAVTN